MSSEARVDELGLYQLAFFSIEISKEIDLNDLLHKNNDFPNKLGVLFHEYIHYLQDLSTTHGLMNISYRLGRLGSFMYQVSKSSESKIKLPITLEEIENADLSDDILKAVLGCSDEWTYKEYDSIKISSIKIEGASDEDITLSALYNDSRLQKFNLPIISLELDIKGLTINKEFSLGSMAIIESMANIVEKHIYPTSNKPQPMYEIAECLVKKIFPSLLKKKENIVSLCDASLMYDNPGLIFYGALTLMRHEDFTCENIVDIYDFVYRRFHPMLFDEYFRSAILHLDNLIPKHNSAYAHLSKFIMNAINNAKASRISTQSFISEIMLKSRHDAKLYIFALMKKMEIPVLIMDGKEIFSTYEALQDSVGIEAFPSLNSLLSVFEGYQGCKNTTICSFYSSQRVCDICYHSPWEKVKENELCPFATLWYTWGFAGKNIVI